MSKKKSLVPLAAITTVLFLAVITRPSPEETGRNGAGTPMLPDLKVKVSPLHLDRKAAHEAAVLAEPPLNHNLLLRAQLVKPERTHDHPHAA